MKSTETEIEVLKVQMENIEKKVDEGFEALKESGAETRRLILDFIEKSEGKFANKWVESAMSWAIYLVMGAVLTAIVYLVLK